jgi:hypothetical protein
MAYDEKLAGRVRKILRNRNGVEEKRMFGGLCFMVAGHMCCGIVGDRLMARVGPENYEECLARKDVKEMDFTGKPMKGMVYVDPAGLAGEEALKYWVDICLQFVLTLPAKV